MQQTYSFLKVWDPIKDSVAPKTIVVTAFLQMQQKILVLQRARKDVQHNLWGIPGGKLINNEPVLSGLVREIKEETNLELEEQSFLLLGTAISNTPCDGLYGLYIYHAFVPENSIVRINSQEHYNFLWVDLTEFQSLELLTAQREAFQFVQEKLEAKISRLKASI